MIVLIALLSRQIIDDDWSWRGAMAYGIPAGLMLSDYLALVHPWKPQKIAETT
jgi:hypothetical protein